MHSRLIGFLSFCMIMAGALAFNAVCPLANLEINNSYSYTDINLDIKEPRFLYGMNVDEYVVIEDKVKRNQFLSDILTSYNVPVKLINQVSAMPRNVFDVRKIAQ